LASIANPHNSKAFAPGELHMRLLLPTLLSCTIAAGVGHWIPGSRTTEPCGPRLPDTTLATRLRSLAAQYHPEALTPAKHNQFQVIALLIDDHCRVLRHATMRREADHLTVDSTMAMLFPKARREPFVLGGIADMGPVDPDQKGAPWVVWLMVKS